MGGNCGEEGMLLHFRVALLGPSDGVPTVLAVRKDYGYLKTSTALTCIIISYSEVHVSFQDGHRTLFADNLARSQIL